MMPYTKPVITDPYYEKPEWIRNEVIRKEFICLSSECDTQDVELFLTHLFGYNHINVDQSFRLSFEELFEQEEVVLSGGIAFFEDEKKYILPSCCCRLEEYFNVIDSITKKQSPWMGHDPTPSITYNYDRVFIWPDDPKSIERSTNYYIKYSYQELLESLYKTQKDVQGFIEGPLFEWIKKSDIEIARTMNDKLKQWIMK